MIVLNQATIKIESANIVINICTSSTTLPLFKYFLHFLTICKKSAIVSLHKPRERSTTMYNKFFLTAAICLVSALAVAGEVPKYEAFCHDGVISAKPLGTKGPAKTLTLLVEGTKTIPCTKDDKIVLGEVGRLMETPQEGLQFAASVSITKKVDPKTTVMIISTFQEKAFPRSKSGNAT